MVKPSVTIFNARWAQRERLGVLGLTSIGASAEGDGGPGGLLSPAPEKPEGGFQLTLGRSEPRRLHTSEALGQCRPLPGPR